MKLNDEHDATRKLRFRRPGARCPRCGVGPALRFHPLERHVHRGRDRNIVLMTYQCHRRGCAEIYAITVGDLLWEN